MHSNNIDLSLIIACYNEQEILVNNVRRLKDILDFARLKYEIIFVDDYSSDRTTTIINDLVSKNNQYKSIFHKENMGRGKSVSDGIKASKGRVVGFIDIDLSTSPTYIPSMVLEIDKGADIATANRIYKLRINPYFLFRIFLSKGYIIFSRFLLKTKLKDTETGYKFFNRTKVLAILDDINNNHWFWDTEIMTNAYFNNYKIIELDTLFKRQPGQKSTVIIFRDIIDYLIALIRFRKRLKEYKQ